MKFQVLHPPQSAQNAQRLDYAREVIRAEEAALEAAAQRLGPSFLDAVDLVYGCRGRLAVTGTGKSADVGQKIAGTLNSTGRAFEFLFNPSLIWLPFGKRSPADITFPLGPTFESHGIDFVHA